MSRGKYYKPIDWHFTMVREYFYGDAAILHTGKFLPEEIVRNDVFGKEPLFKYDINGKKLSEEGVICTDEWIKQRTGIAERRKCVGLEDSSYMACQAIRNALDGNLDPQMLDGIISATVTFEQSYPSVACVAQKDLGITGNNRFVAHDVGAACAGFGAAVINAASRFAISDLYRFIAVSASEHLTKEVDYTDQNAPLFGDGAGAVIIGRTGSTDGLEGRIVGHYEGSTVEKERLDLIVRDPNGKLRMPYGNKVFSLAVRNMANAVTSLKEDLGWSNDDIDLVIPHQANSRIIETVANQSGLGMEKVFTNVKRYGNMSSATCPVALDEAIKEGRIDHDSKVVVVSFGSGLVTSAFAMDYKKQKK